MSDFISRGNINKLTINSHNNDCYQQQNYNNCQYYKNGFMKVFPAKSVEVEIEILVAIN